MMKSLLASVLVAVSLGSPYAHADMRNCAARIRIIESKIEIARQVGNPYKVAGLQQALRRVRLKCGHIGADMPVNPRPEKAMRYPSDTD
ncbi:hypothetical protein DM44_4157 [Burkholderia cepacia]|jgi:hypothetical protein|nr:hypothetical protein DM42_6259 [Burkholderia cepacia]KGC02494.1 hypothetical protein DM44_4157 [Burkholderia cepacia]MCW3735831.1 DUF1090 domain-containing protein [Burkholderia cenocepacia]